MNPALPCPCGRPDRPGRPYRDCCGPLHDGTRDATTAEDLMRSRYSAYVLDQQGYLLASWHASTRPVDLPPPEPGLRWLGLDVKRHVPIDDDHATVEFVARSKLGGRAHRLHEVSRFVREGGRWFYVDGDLA
jgi:SEC-C motif-containing protein